VANTGPLLLFQTSFYKKVSVRQFVESVKPTMIISKK